jgi:hypothetical protein
VAPAASVLIILHLLAVGCGVLSARSGPWLVPPPVGASPAEPPKFAEAIHRLSGPTYLQHIKLAHTYHYASNRPGQPAVKLEVVLKFADGNTKTIIIPDKDANPWVQHRQTLLLQGLADDGPLPNLGGVELAPEDGKVATLQYWEAKTPDSPMRLVTRPKNKIPRNTELSRPSDWSLLLVRSYARYLCRVHGAESAEMIRRTRMPLQPSEMYRKEQPDQEPNPELIASFGEFSK